MDFIDWLVIAIVVDCVVVITNIIEQVLICRKWSFLDRIDHILLSLSICDLLSGLVMLVTESMILSQVLDNTFFTDTSPMQYILDTAIDSVFLFTVFASTFHVIAVAIERFYAIRFPRKYYIFTTFKAKCRTIVMVWILSLLFTITFSVLHSLSLDAEVGVFIRGCVLAISASLVFVIYMYIAYLLIKQRRNNMEVFSGENQEHRLKRLTIICLFLGISFVVCVLPITFTCFNPDFYHHFSNIAITMNSIINPIIYFVKVHYESRLRNITRQRSNANNALLDTRTATMTTDI